MRKAKQLHYQKKEKQVRRWMDELNSLYETKKEKSIVHKVDPPIFRGYLVSFVLTTYGNKTLSSEEKDLFFSKRPTFFTTDKKYAKSLKPDPTTVFVGSYCFNPDLKDIKLSNYRPVWPIIFYREKPRNISTKYINPDEIVSQFWFYNHGVWYYNLPEKAFRIKISKYHQTLIYVESAKIDSRINYLHEKLFDQKNYYKYLKERSEPRYWDRPPVSYYYDDTTGISPSKPYNRHRFKHATRKLINKNGLT